MAYVHVKQLSLAIDDFTQSANIDPENVDAISNAAMAHYESRHYDVAIRESDRAIKIDPERSLPYAVRALANAAPHTLGMLIKQARRSRQEN